MSGGMHIGDELNKRKFRLQPRFTIIHHPIREKHGLSFTAYAVIYSVHQLSHRPDYPWCTMSKEKLGDFLDVTRPTVHRAIKDGLDEGLLEKNDRGDYRSTQKWIEEVVLYDGKSK